MTDEGTIIVKLGVELKDRFRACTGFHGDISHVTRLLIDMYCDVREGKLTKEEALAKKMRRFI
jgi:hypothetical protein